MLKLIFIGALLFVNIISIAGDDEDDCEACTMQADSGIACIQDIIKKIEPVMINNCNPCKQCAFSGIHDLKRMEDKQVCTHEKPGGIVEHKFYVQFKKIKLECDCELDSDPSKIPEELMKFLNTNQTEQCPPDKRAEASKGLESSAMPKPKLQDLKEMSACHPTDGSEKVKGKLVGYWEGPKVYFTTTTKEGSDKVSMGYMSVISRDYKNIKAKCIGDAKFKQPCECLLAGNFAEHVAVTTLTLLMPCDVDSAAQKQPDLAQYLTCDD